MADHYHWGLRSQGRLVQRENVFGALDASDLFEPPVMVRYDINTMTDQSGRIPFLGDQTVMVYCQEHPIDCVVYHRSPEDMVRPARETLEWIHDAGIPLVSFHTDPDGDLVRDVLDRELSMVDVHWMMSGFDATPFTRHPERYIRGWAPQNDRLVYNPQGARPIAVSFTGHSVAENVSYPNRDEGRAFTLHVLRERGIEITTIDRTAANATTDVTGDCSMVDYFRLLQESRMTINFASDKLKSRVIEATLCGALLFEPAGSPAAVFFQPEVEYVPFTDVDDLERRIRYYLVHDDERVAIAERGWLAATTKYSARQVWMTILNRLRDRDPAWSARC